MSIIKRSSNAEKQKRFRDKQKEKGEKQAAAKEQSLSVSDLYHETRNLTPLIFCLSFNDPFF